mmetsp:Transcript_70061/g.194714  ORF Transcript_70061/g.194714 Transcript_70061/m.194714 type:complete len:127 (+) Transcript_70061:752-1132(+)
MDAAIKAAIATTNAVVAFPNTSPPPPAFVAKAVAMSADGTTSPAGPKSPPPDAIDMADATTTAAQANAAQPVESATTPGLSLVAALVASASHDRGRLQGATGGSQNGGRRAQPWSPTAPLRASTLA